MTLIVASSAALRAATHSPASRAYSSSSSKTGPWLAAAQSHVAGCPRAAKPSRCATRWLRAFGRTCPQLDALELALAEPDVEERRDGPTRETTPLVRRIEPVAHDTDVPADVQRCPAGELAVDAQVGPDPTAGDELVDALPQPVACCAQP